jgi:hypothetical protein
LENKRYCCVKKKNWTMSLKKENTNHLKMAFLRF